MSVAIGAATAMKPSPELEIPIHVFQRLDETDDDALGNRLVSATCGAVERGGAPAAAVAVRSTQFDIIPLLPLVQQQSPIPPFVAGLSTSPTEMGAAEAVGVMGTFRWRRDRSDAGVPIALVFLEWTDCRWWFWRALLQPEGEGLRLREDTETRACAVDGDAKPLGLGGWWSLGRRSNVRIHLQPRSPVWVH